MRERYLIFAEIVKRRLRGVGGSKRILEHLEGKFSSDKGCAKKSKD